LRQPLTWGFPPVKIAFFGNVPYNVCMNILGNFDLKNNKRMTYAFVFLLPVMVLLAAFCYPHGFCRDGYRPTDLEHYS